MKYNIKKENNHSLATIKNEKSETVTAYFTIDIHEETSLKSQTVEMLYSEALLSGTERYTRAEFLNAINLLGANLSVLSSDSNITIVLKSTSQTFVKLLKLFEEMMSSPVFVNSELSRIKTTAVNELHAAKEDSKTISFNRMINSFYGKGDRKYTHSIDEVINEIPNITPKHLKTLHTKVMSQFWFCSIGGCESHITALNKAVYRLKRDTEPRTLTSTHQQKTSTKKVVLKQIASRQNIDFSIGASLPITLHHPDYIPLIFAISVLGNWGGFTGRLMSTVREQEGLTYGIYSRAEGFSGTEQGYWRIMTFFSPEKTLQGLKSTFREITNLYEKGITQVELDKFKTILNTKQTLMRDSIGGMLYDLHTYHCHQFTLEEIKEHKARISTLTLEEVNGVIKKHLNPTSLTVSGAGPTKSIESEIKSFINSVK